MPYVLALDSGTTSARAIVFDHDGSIRSVAQKEFAQLYPKPGWVEHDPLEIWTVQISVAVEALGRAGLRPDELAALGITNQRETAVVWDRQTGEPVGNAIVWQDRRTADLCGRLRAAGQEALIRERTGLLLDPYFSATKIAWMLETVAGARAAAERGDLAAGTIDSYLLWRLTGGVVHATDATNASRTMLFDIHRQAWDDDLLALFGVPRALLPDVMDCAAEFGMTEPSLFGGAIRIAGIAGDQHAATAGQACFEAGAIKSTYGTGCFAVVNTGDTPLASRNRLLTTLAYRLDGRPTYAIEGSIFIAGAAVQWLRDGLGIIGQAAESEALAARARADSGVYLVPAFTGLGAPYWDAGARGALYGLTRDSGAPEIARAALESVAYQTRDLFEAMAADGTERPKAVRVDGGMTENAWFLQFLADQLAAEGWSTDIRDTPEGKAILADKGERTAVTQVTSAKDGGTRIRVLVTQFAR